MVQCPFQSAATGQVFCCRASAGKVLTHRTPTDGAGVTFRNKLNCRSGASVALITTYTRSIARYELCSALYIAAKFKRQEGGREISDYEFVKSILILSLGYLTLAEVNNDFDNFSMAIKEYLDTYSPEVQSRLLETTDAAILVPKYIMERGD
ncbi:hypothetical protein RR46_02330 [Papilio xuthus]|uniref:Uncharacterized protein n=1 Tax=Papilio xuthus TaxID=66420 RepID=A0A194Q1B4_PAPXU|nr:hypothetical protein RR46_02330 [Papilio xuthus]